MRISRLFAGTAVCCLAVSAANAQLINEININPPSTDNPFEYVELIGTPGAALTNLYFVAFEGDGLPSGTADFVVNLTGQTFGSNGLLVVKSPTGGFTFPAATTIVTDAQLNTAGGGIENGTNSYFLFSSPNAFVEGTDYDTNNDGTLDGLPAGFSVLDNLGISDGDAGDLVYGGVLLTQSSGTPDAVARFAGNTTPSTASAFYNADYVTGGANSSTDLDETRASANFPAGADLTPGAANAVAVIPEANTFGLLSLALPVVGAIIARRRK